MDGPPKSEVSWTPPPFTELSFAELTATAIPLSEPDFQYWTVFNAKDEKPPGRK